MRGRVTTVLLTTVLVMVLAVAGVVVRRLEHAPPTISDVSIGPEASARAERARALAAHAPMKGLGAPASTRPDKVERRTLTKAEPDMPGSTDGLVTTVTITTPAFTIAQRFRSMEGPYADYTTRLDGAAPDAGDAGAVRQLWWWKGARIELFDADDHPVGQEFMCHLNIDVDGESRRSVLGRRPDARRLLTLTQGELSFALPKGVGVPAASDEQWSTMFQVLNHNRDGEFHIKQRLTLYFVRDVDLFAPIEPASWQAASIWVPVDKSSPDALASDKLACHCCLPLTRGLEATNNVALGRTVDAAGRVLVGHWTVPPAKSTWAYPVRLGEKFPAKDQKLYATWTHLHPFATEARLSAHKPGCAPAILARSEIESLRDGRVGLVKIKSFASPEGVPLPEGAIYELAVDYDNTSGRPQDSMTSLGMFVSDDTWTRPEWASRAQNTSGMDGSCGTGP
jgi:hypothetical protein